MVKPDDTLSIPISSMYIRKNRLLDMQLCKYVVDGNYIYIYCCMLFKY
jgi:hypothetical protein